MLQANVAEKILKSLGSISPVQTAIVPTFTVGLGIETVPINGKNISLQALTGNIWVSLLGDPAITALTGFKVTAGSVVEAFVAGDVTLISDVTTGTAQIMVWGV